MAFRSDYFVEELRQKGVFTDNIIRSAVRIRSSMKFQHTQRNSPKHRHLAFLSVFQAYTVAKEDVDRYWLGSIFDLDRSETERTFMQYPPIQTGIHLPVEPDTIESCIIRICQHDELRLYDQDTIDAIVAYGKMMVRYNPDLNKSVPHTIASAIVYDYMNTNRIILNDPRTFFRIVNLTDVTIGTVLRNIRS